MELLPKGESVFPKTNISSTYFPLWALLYVEKEYELILLYLSIRHKSVFIAIDSPATDSLMLVTGDIQ
jgi:hypothetical protein